MRAVMLVGSDGSSSVQLLVGEERGEILEPRTLLGLLRVAAVDRVDLEHRRVLLVAPAGRILPVTWSPLRSPNCRASLTRM